MKTPALTAHLIETGNAVEFIFPTEYRDVFKELPWDVVYVADGNYKGYLSLHTIDGMALGLAYISDYVTVASDLVELLLAEIN